ncbi:hypothetical protein [uncultured Rothia sp.]|uniref:hypothetical protein n=1 Tax=uncultured Rothia sp. TaxID=316088 RepID=UPI003216DB3B
MSKEVQPCGTHAAYVRHRRKGEECVECRESERERVALRRAERREAEIAVQPSGAFLSHIGDVGQVVRQGDEPVRIEVPLSFDPVDSAKWRLAKVRGAMAVSSPRDMAALAKVEAEIIELLNELAAPKEEKKVSALDQLAAKRAERLAAS